MAVLGGSMTSPQTLVACNLTEQSSTPSVPPRPRAASLHKIFETGAHVTLPARLGMPRPITTG